MSYPIPEVEDQRYEPYTGRHIGPPEPLAVEIKGRSEVVETPERSPQTAQHTLVSAEPYVVQGPTESRRVGVILNTAAVNVYVLSSRSGNVGSGFLLAPGASLTVRHQGPVVVAAPSATQTAQVTISWYAEVED